MLLSKKPYKIPILSDKSISSSKVHKKNIDDRFGIVCKILCNILKFDDRLI